jgi:type 1 glutamine amidotransferase
MFFSRHLPLLLISVLNLQAESPQPKKILGISITTTFRHTSIEIAEKTLAAIAAKDGRFQFDFIQQPEGWLRQPKAPQIKPNESQENFEKRNLTFSNELKEYQTQIVFWNNKTKAYLAEKANPEQLKKYDAYFFINSTGEIPLPDPQALIDEVTAGKALLAVHSGSDTYHQFRPYIDLLGGEFDGHKAQVSVKPIIRNQTQAPFTNLMTSNWEVFDEIYLIKSYDPTKVIPLLGLDAHPNDGIAGDYPLSWCKEVGKGRVFYSSIGHREDIWDPHWQPSNANETRKNTPEAAELYQKYIHQAILWSLKIEP